MSRTGITLAITGASGVQYALRLLECLLERGEAVHLLVTRPAQVVIGTETGLELPARSADMRSALRARFSGGELEVHGREAWTAPVASGSGAPRRMVICPCSAATLGDIASGGRHDLVARAAEVVLKEGGRLILVPRETPLSMIQLENMLRLARAGATILPASPGFYHRPTDIGELIDFVVARILDQLDIEHRLLPRWGRG